MGIKADTSLERARDALVTTRHRPFVVVTSVGLTRGAVGDGERGAGEGHSPLAGRTACGPSSVPGGGGWRRGTAGREGGTGDGPVGSRGGRSAFRGQLGQRGQRLTVRRG